MIYTDTAVTQVGGAPLLTVTAPVSFGVINQQPLGYATGGFSNQGPLNNLCPPFNPATGLNNPGCIPSSCGPFGGVGNHSFAPSVAPTGGLTTYPQGCCGPTFSGLNGICGPSIGPVGNDLLAQGYNTGMYGQGFGRPNNCCGPTFATGMAGVTGGQILPGSNNGLCGGMMIGGPANCCAPSLNSASILNPQAGFVNPGYNTNPFCGSAMGSLGLCFPAFSAPPGVTSMPGSLSPSGLCGPSLPGQNNCCTPPVGTYNTLGYNAGSYGICNCCMPTSGNYLVQTQVKGESNAIYQAPVMNPVQATIVNQVMSPYMNTSGLSAGDSGILLNPVEKLSTEAAFILQNIGSSMPLNTVNIPFGPPQYLPEKQGIYVGQWINGFMNGYGKIFFNNGGYFEGQFVNGIANTPNGCFIYPDGSYYIGAVFNNFANGQGVYTYKNNSLVYEGGFLNDQPEGRGIERYADGSSYNGDFRFGRKQGRGRFVWRDGTQYEGQFEAGFMQGVGVHRLSNGEVYEGEFRKNKRHGTGRYTTPLGIYVGGYRNDTKQGEGRFTWFDGRSFQGTFRDGCPDGPCIFVLPNGTALNLMWVNGTLDLSAVDEGVTNQIGSIGVLGGTITYNNIGNVLVNPVSIQHLESTLDINPPSLPLVGSYVASPVPLLTIQTLTTQIVAPSLRGSRVIGRGSGVGPMVDVMGNVGIPVLPGTVYAPSVVPMLPMGQGMGTVIVPNTNISTMMGTPGVGIVPLPVGVGFPGQGATDQMRRSFSSRGVSGVGVMAPGMGVPYGAVPMTPVPGMAQMGYVPRMPLRLL